MRFAGARQVYREDKIKLDRLQALALPTNMKCSNRRGTPPRVEARSELAAQVHQPGADVRQRSAGQVRGARYVPRRRGEVIQDIFSSQCWLADPTLIDKLALERLDAKAEALRADGWSWTDPVLSIGNVTLATYPTVPEPTDAGTAYADPAHEARHTFIGARLDQVWAMTRANWKTEPSRSSRTRLAASRMSSNTSSPRPRSSGRRPSSPSPARHSGRGWPDQAACRPAAARPEGQQELRFMTCSRTAWFRPAPEMP